MPEETIFTRLRVIGQRVYSRDMRQAARDTDELGHSSDRAGRSAHRMTGNYDALGRVMKLVKPAAMITSLGLLAQGTSAAAAGAVALGAAVAPAAGGLVALPSIAAAGAQGLSVVKLATNGVGDAVGGLNDRLDRTSSQFRSLSPEARRFAVHLARVKAPLRDLQRLAQGELFPGVDRGFASASRNLPVLKPIVAGTAGTAGGIAADAGAMLGSAAWGRDIATQGARNVSWLTRGGAATLRLANAARNLVVTGGPLVGWLVAGSAHMATFVDREVEAGRESGHLAKGFAAAREPLTQLWRVASGFGGTLWNVARGGRALGGDLLRSLGDGAQQLSRWTGSARGQNSIAGFFERARAPIYAVSRLAKDIVVTFARLGTHSGLAPMIDQLDTELLPVLDRVVNSTTEAFGPHAIDLLIAMTQAFEPLAGSSGPLIVLVDLLTGLARASVWIATTVPGGSAALSVLFGTLAVTKALGIASFTSNLLGMGRGITVVKGVATGATVALAAFNATTLGTRVGLVALAAQGAVVAGGMKVLTGAQWLLNAAMDANPILLAATALAVLAVGLVVAYKKVRWFHGAVDATWGFIKDHWPLLVGILTGPFGFAAASIIKHFSEVKAFVIGVLNFLIRRYNDVAGPLPGLDPINEIFNDDVRRGQTLRTVRGGRARDFARGLLQAPGPLLAGASAVGDGRPSTHGAGRPRRDLHARLDMDGRQVGRAVVRNIDDEDQWR